MTRRFARTDSFIVQSMDTFRRTVSTSSRAIVLSVSSPSTFPTLAGGLKAAAFDGRNVVFHRAPDETCISFVLSLLKLPKHCYWHFETFKHTPIYACDGLDATLCAPDVYVFGRTFGRNIEAIYIGRAIVLAKCVGQHIEGSCST